MIPYASPQQQAWWQAIQQQQALYQRQIAQQVGALAYQQPVPGPSVFGGMGRYTNPLLAMANNSGTALFRPTDPAAGNPLLQQTLASAGQPGDTGISSDPRLIQALMGGTGGVL